MHTSSISNFNIAARVHRDNANLQGTCNIIYNKKKNTSGGDLFLPDYNAVIESADNSIIVYPAWRNSHGVTPIKPTRRIHHRNTLVFYSLAYFAKLA